MKQSQLSEEQKVGKKENIYIFILQPEIELNYLNDALILI